MRHVLHVDAGHHLEQLTRDVLLAPDTARAHVGLARIGFGIGDEFGGPS